MELIRLTTPTIQFTFKDIDTAQIEKAYLVIKNRQAIIEKAMDEATVTQGMLEWKLTQQESQRLKVGEKVKIYCDWLLKDGTRGRSKTAEYMVADTGKNEVI